MADRKGLATLEGVGSSDVRLRELERRWCESNAPDDATAYATALQRAGAPPHETARVRIGSEDPDGYLNEVLRLPRPTLQQVANFARFVSMCHSWYKHLRFTPAHEFQFYLSPVSDRWEGDFHYASHPAEFHRREYGHFEFWFPSEREPMPIAGVDHGTARVPPILVEAGTAQVTGVMHHRCMPMGAGFTKESDRQHLEEYEEIVRAELAPRGVVARLRNAFSTPDSWSDVFFQHAPGERDRQLAGMEAAMNRVLGLIYGPAEDGEHPVADGDPWFSDRRGAIRRPGP